MNKYERWKLLEEYYFKTLFRPGIISDPFSMPKDFHSLPDKTILELESSWGFALYKFRYRCQVFIKSLFPKVKK